MCCQDVRDVYPTFMGSNLPGGHTRGIIMCMHARTAITHVYVIATYINTPDIILTCCLTSCRRGRQNKFKALHVYTTKQLNTIPEKTVSTFNVALISTSLSKIEELKNCLLKCYEHVSVCYWQTACTGKLCSIIIHQHYTFNNLCHTVCANPSVFPKSPLL